MGGCGNSEVWEGREVWKGSGIKLIWWFLNFKNEMTEYIYAIDLNNISIRLH